MRFSGVLPDYWSAAASELGERDAVLRALIAGSHGMQLRSRGDAFSTLARSIVGQQISVKAADSVWSRFAGRVGGVAPAAVLDVGIGELRGCGLSQRKAEYLVDLAARFASGEIDPGVWHGCDDETLIVELSRVRGIGRWTSEMFLIFHLLRPDVLPLDDIGLQRAMSREYNGGTPLDRARMCAIGDGWRPWRSVATWYLWRSLDPIPVEY